MENTILKGPYNLFKQKSYVKVKWKLEQRGRKVKEQWLEITSTSEQARVPFTNVMEVHFGGAIMKLRQTRSTTVHTTARGVHSWEVASSPDADIGSTASASQEVRSRNLFLKCAKIQAALWHSLLPRPQLLSGLEELWNSKSPWDASQCWNPEHWPLIWHWSLVLWTLALTRHSVPTQQLLEKFLLQVPYILTPLT